MTVTLYIVRVLDGGVTVTLYSVGMEGGGVKVTLYPAGGAGWWCDCVTHGSGICIHATI